MNEAMQIHTTVIYHSADFDGIFCREIAKKFLGDGPGIQFIGWDFGQPKITVPLEGAIYILDLSPECLDAPYGALVPSITERIIWIDHHKSSMEKWPAGIPGYRIDGVSACRLAWQWFMQQWRKSAGMVWLLPDKMQFVERLVDEPLAVRLAGEYDVWDKRDPDAEVFQFGLRSGELTEQVWSQLLAEDEMTVGGLLAMGKMLQRYQQANDAGVMNFRSFMVEFEGLKFLALNTARCNSLTFAAKDVPETGHDALMGFFFDGKAWKFSLYHAKHNTGIDLSAIAVRYGGGGHRGACGFQAQLHKTTINDGKLTIRL